MGTHEKRQSARFDIGGQKNKQRKLIKKNKKTKKKQKRNGGCPSLCFYVMDVLIWNIN